MSRQRKKQVTKRPTSNDVMSPQMIVSILVEAYCTGLTAIEKKQPELAAISAYYIFDVLDWARCNFVGTSFDTIELTLPDGFLSHKRLPAPKNIRQLESSAEKHFVGIKNTPKSASLGKVGAPDIRSAV